MKILSLPATSNRIQGYPGVFEENIDKNHRYSVNVYYLSNGVEWKTQSGYLRTYYVLEGFVTVSVFKTDGSTIGTSMVNAGKGWTLLPGQSQVVKAEVESKLFSIQSSFPLNDIEITDRAKKAPINSSVINELSDYVVNKPWGSEQWLVDTGVYVLKGIQMNAGHECSLHLHEQKIEVNLILSGRVRLLLGRDSQVDDAIAQHYKNGGVQTNFSMASDLVDSVKNNIKTVVIAPGEGWKARPYEMHQVLSLDTYFALEVSTPEVDDIIRLKDLYNRPNGRIVSEHKQ